MHDRIFLSQRTMGVPVLKQHAVGMGLDTGRFDQCLDSGKFAASVAADLKYGETLGVQSTPTIYINGRAVLGAQPYDVFQQVIDEELARK
jgi:predicted DsbA family dithiol-disulfide isomerase